MHGFGVGCQLVKHLGAFGELLVVLALLVEKSDCLSVTATRVAELLLFPVQVAQPQQQHAFLYAAAGGFFVAFLVCGDGVRRVALVQINVADGVVNLVEVILVVVICRHAFQSANHLFGIVCRHHLGHGDAGVELQLVGRVLADDAFERFVSQLAVSERSLQLSHEKPLAGFLLAAHLVLDDFAQVGDGFLVFAGVYVIVGVGVVPLLHCPPVERVALHIAYHVLGIVHPALLDIRLGEPCACLAVDGRLCLVKAAHVGEGRCRVLERSLMELRASHEHPRLPQERVVLAAAEPLNVFRGLPPALGELGTFLDAVLFDCLLTLLDGAVEVALSYLPAVLVAHGVERNDFGEIVPVAFFLLQ